VEARAVLGEGDPLGRLAERRAHVKIQALQFAHRSVVAPQDRLRPEHLRERLEDRVAHRLHARRGDLRHQHVGVAVHHEPRQAVAFAIGEPVEGFREQTAAKRQRHLEPVHQQRGAERVRPVPAHQPRADERLRVGVTGADGPAAMILDHHRLPGREVLDGGRRGVHLVAEHPGVARQQAPFLVLLQAQGGEVEGFHGAIPERGKGFEVQDSMFKVQSSKFKGG
jgi:hypothetical protein